MPFSQKKAWLSPLAVSAWPTIWRAWLWWSQTGASSFFRMTPLARAVLLLPLLSAVLTGLTLFLAVLAWRRGYWSLWRRLHYSLLGLSGLAFMGSLHYWNLLGLGF